MKISDRETDTLRRIREALGKAARDNTEAHQAAASTDEPRLRYEGFGLGTALRYAHQLSSVSDLTDAIEADLRRYERETGLSRDTRFQVYREADGLKAALAIVRRRGEIVTAAEPEPIDSSRYRIAATIVERWRAGESVYVLADDYGRTEYQIELIVAAAESAIDTVTFDTTFQIPTPGVYAFHLDMAEAVWHDGVKRRGTVRLSRLGGLPSPKAEGP